MIYLMPNYFDFEQYQVGRYYFINLYVKKPVRDNRPFISLYTTKKYSRDDESDFVQFLAGMPHTRHSAYKSNRYQSVIRKLKEQDPNVNYAANVCIEAANSDITSDVMMIMAIPIYGFLGPIHKSRDYDLINGALIMTDMFMDMSHFDPNVAGVEMMMRAPFSEANGNACHGMFNFWPDSPPRKLVYIAVETKYGSFNFYDYIPSRDRFTAINRIEYGYYLNHIFQITPNVMADSSVMLSPNYECIEGLIPITPKTESLFARSTEKLFHLSDLPNGVTKSSTHTSVEL